MSLISTLVILLLFLFSIIHGYLYSLSYNYDEYGLRMASNDYFVVLARNEGTQFSVMLAPFGLGFFCDYAYQNTRNYVLHVAVGRNQNASQLSFVYLYTNSTRGLNQKLGIFRFSRSDNNNLASTCQDTLGLNEGEHDVKVWNEEASEVSIMQVDPDGRFVYGFILHTTFIYDIENDHIEEIIWEKFLPSINFRPHAVDIGRTNDGIQMAVLAGYFIVSLLKTLPCVYLIRLNPPFNMTIVDNLTLETDLQHTVRVDFSFYYYFEYTMSVSIHHQTQQVLVGVTDMDKTFLLSFNSTNIVLLNVFPRGARSVTWLNDNGTEAALLLTNVTTLPWALSQVHAINVHTTLYSPLWAYPNNQQTLVESSGVISAFLRMKSTYDNQLIVLTNKAYIAFIPASPSGYYIKTDDITSERYSPEICPPGTYKNIYGVGPCIVCPTQTKNSLRNSSIFSDSNQTMSSITCVPCLPDSFCPLGSVGDVNISLFSSMSQAYAYPVTQGSTSFGEVLITHVFYVEWSSSYCLMVSPMFWTLLSLAISSIILVIMGILHFIPTYKIHGRRLARFLQSVDLIGNGELWLGGLVSLALIVQIIFAFYFSFQYVNQYPIETASDAHFTCNRKMRNTKFSSALQHLATIKSDEETRIFELLDEQNFTLSMDFVQTGFDCSQILAQEILGSYTINLHIRECYLQPDNATRTVVINVPFQEMTIQFNLTGPSYIGATRICLNGPSLTFDGSVYTIQQLASCQLVANPDQTLDQTTRISVEITKVINRTESLDINDRPLYSGIWIPKFTVQSRRDHFAYEQYGPYIRYLTTSQVLVISLTETQFYIQNIQEPIARQGEIVFQDILFTTTAIGIFALAFLILNRTILPVCQRLFQRLLNRRENKNRSIHSLETENELNLTAF